MEIKERSLDELHLSVCVNILNFRFFSGPKEQKIETTLIKISLIFRFYDTYWKNEIYLYYAWVSIFIWILHEILNCSECNDIGAV